MTASEKVAYLKGLMEGQKLDKATDQGKLFAAIADVLEDLALDVQDLDDGLAELAAQVDEIDEDLAALEDDYLEDNMDEDDELFEVTCPSCGDTIYLDYDMLEEGELECPACGEHLEFDLDDIDGCDCEDCKPDGE